MNRVPEPELMDGEEQAEAYSLADFSEAHERFVELFRESFGAASPRGPVLDLGCGTADVTIRFAKAHPAAEIDGVDGAESMLRWGREAVELHGLSGRVRLYRRYLPDDALPRERYSAVVSNSLLHHLKDPLDLWRTIRAYAAPGAPVLVMDLLRPASADAALAVVERHAAGEASILRTDFYHSLCAAYRPEEVAEQLRHCGLEDFAVRIVSDRHWIAAGRVPGPAE